jgi:hypothetical protein
LSRYAPPIWLWAILLVIGLFLGFLGLFRPNAGTLLPGLLFVVGSFACLIPLFVGLARSPREARTTPEGVQWLDKKGEHRCRWDEITAVFRLEKIINQTFLVKQSRMVLAHGEEVTFDQSLSDYDRLANAIQGTVTQKLLPAKRSQLTGAGVEFGPVTLHRDGITINGKKFPWPEVEQYVVFRGSFVVYPRSYQGIQCEEVVLSDVPNYPILLLLLQGLGQAPVPPQQSILFLGRRR